jgi:hypothetical protein
MLFWHVQVHDISSEEGDTTNFELLEGLEYWEVPIEGGPPPDNPVPAGNGALYGSTAPAASTVAAPPAAPPGTAAAAAPEDLFTTENGGDYTGPVENGHSAGLVRHRPCDHPQSLPMSLACTVRSASGSAAQQLASF